MAANVETMFSTRVKPWHGFGVIVKESPTSKDALHLAGLDWSMEQRPIQTIDGVPLNGFRASVRSTDKKVLGVVTDKYKIVQNDEAFAFTDALLGEGVTYETADFQQEGRKVWLLATLPHKYLICGDEVTPYLVFSNSHEGSGAIKVTMTPVRVVCNNTLNLAPAEARRCWSTIYTGNLSGKLQNAKQTLLHADAYMQGLAKSFEELRKVKLTDRKVMGYIDILLPELDNPTPQQTRNIVRLKEDLKARYFDAPDLKDVGKNGYRFINAVSDFATHAKPIRMTRNYQENLFGRTMEGNALIDRAYGMLRAA